MSRRTARRARRQAGFSLVEMLTALFIVSLASAFAVMTLPPRLDATEAQARVFAAKLDQAGDQAVIWGASVGAVVDDEGYRFQRRGRLGWEPIVDDPALEPKLWAEPTTVTLNAPRLRPSRIRQLQRRDVVVPLIRFDPMGQAQPIEVRLQFERADYAVRIADDGSVSVEPLNAGLDRNG